MPNDLTIVGTANCVLACHVELSGLCHFATRAMQGYQLVHIFMSKYQCHWCT